jgi:hypothetical protein
MLHLPRFLLRLCIHLYVLAHHGNHQIEQSNSFNESESQNGIREELSTHAWVASNSHEQGSEDHSDTDTSTTETDGSGAHTQVLRDLNHRRGDLRVEAASSLASHSVAGCGVEEGACLLALEGLESIVANAAGDA